jgi:hypothetical protein
MTAKSLYGRRVGEALNVNEDGLKEAAKKAKAEYADTFGHDVNMHVFLAARLLNVLRDQKLLIQHLYESLVETDAKLDALQRAAEDVLNRSSVKPPNGDLVYEWLYRAQAAYLEMIQAGTRPAFFTNLSNERVEAQDID